MHAKFGLGGGRKFADTARFVSSSCLTKGWQKVMQLFALQWRILDLPHSPFFRTCRRWLGLSCLVWPLWGGIAPAAVWAQTGAWNPEPYYEMAFARTEHATALSGDNVTSQVLMVTGGIGNGNIGTVAFTEFFSDSGYFYGNGWMSESRQGHTATSVLHNSYRALVTGGFSSTAATVVASAEFLETDSWGQLQSVRAPSMQVPRIRHTATSLPGGDVLVVGGNLTEGEGEILHVPHYFDTSSFSYWSSTQPMQVRREQHTAVLLPSGKVLVAGGLTLGGATASVELFDRATNAWSSARSMGVARYGHTATLLPSGQVLVAGGKDTAGMSLSAAELYDPGTDTWIPVGSMASARYRHTASLLPTGEVLVAGGYSGLVVDSAERFDPFTRTWQMDASMPQVRASHTATLMADGKVLLVGGEGNSGALSSTVSYRYQRPLWADAQDQGTARGDQKAVLLASGKVLSTGGVDAAGPVATAELYDPALNSWTAASSMGAPRHRHTITLLTSGKVLVAGGIASRSAEVYDPATDTWTNTPDMGVVRERPSATLLDDGRVLVLGGEGAAADSAEIYDPALNTWTMAAAPGRPFSGHSAVLLASGKVLVLGGDTGSVPQASQLYDPVTDSWSDQGQISMRQATLTKLRSGVVLAAGGYHAGQALSEAYLYYPQLGWRRVADLPQPRARHAAVLLDDGRVLIAGGDGATSGAPVSSPYDSALVFDESRFTWTEVTSLRTARAELGLVLLPSGRALGVGGTVGGNQHTTEVDQFEQRFAVTPAWHEGGDMSPALPVSALRGERVSFTVRSNPGAVASVQGCGGTLVGTVYTTGPITAHCNVTASFAVGLTVTAVAGTGGTISPNGAQVVPAGDSIRFTVTPQTGYQIASVVGCGGTRDQNEYTISAVTQSCTVTAAFTPILHAVTASALPGGSISPTGMVNVTEGQVSSFTVTPAAGYRIAAVTGCGGTLAGSTYTTAAVTAACTVQARFETLPRPTDTGSGPVNVGVVDDATSCQLDLAGTGPMGAPAPYPGGTLPHGAFRVRLVNCQPGATVRVAVTFPDLTGMTVKKYGPTPDSPARSRYYDPANLQISGNTVTYDVTDGGWGDNSFGVQDGTINDPVVPVLLAASGPAAIPTLSAWSLVGLAALLGLAAGWGGGPAPGRLRSVGRATKN